MKPKGIRSEAEVLFLLIRLFKIKPLTKISLDLHRTFIFPNIFLVVVVIELQRGRAP